MFPASPVSGSHGSSPPAGQRPSFDLAIFNTHIQLGGSGRTIDNCGYPKAVATVSNANEFCRRDLTVNL